MNAITRSWSHSDIAVREGGEGGNERGGMEGGGGGGASTLIPTRVGDGLPEKGEKERRGDGREKRHGSIFQPGPASRLHEA